MVRIADTQDVERLLAAGAQVLEVLPPSAFEREHLPGAVNIPLPQLTSEEIEAAGLDAHRPTVVYCYDHECDLSSRAAALLEAFGFDEVYDYATSKTAWLGEGLPAEGTVSSSSRAGAIARSMPTCGLHDQVGMLHSRFGSDGLCAVVDGDDIVLGVVRQEACSLDGDTPVHEVMQPGPPSVRPSITAAELAENMEQDGRRFVVVSTSLGRLLGVITMSDLHGQH
jgi:rhodanese-related sulfurtransferase